MHRFYLPPEQCQSAELILRGTEAHHATDVLRVQLHEGVIVLDGAGGEYLCEVGARSRSEARLAVLERHAIAPLPYRITLAQALPKGKLFESILQKATELGAYAVVPLLSARVIAHFDEKERAQKLQRWRTVATEAIKQSGSAWLPRVSLPISPQQFLQQAGEYELAFVGSLKPGAEHPRAVFQNFERENARKPDSACVWIGPEGDFTPDELRLIENSGAHPITLGRWVLRTETAATYCLSILNYEFTSGRD